MTHPDCVFCHLEAAPVLRENEHFFSIPDKFPLQKGHSLLISKRHIQTLFEMNDEEVLALHRLLNEVKDLLDVMYQPDGYNIGVNQGAAAGQSVFHLHVHIIPRYEKDHMGPFFG